jgi:hypothetical protein
MTRKKDALAPPSGWIALFRIVDTILDRFGWPGCLLGFGIYFVERYATPEQKVAIINMYVLGAGARTLYPYVALGIIGVVAFVAQRVYYRKKITLLKDETKRLGKWKSEHQEKQIGVPLHHSEDAED